MKLFQFYKDNAACLGAELDGILWDLGEVGRLAGLSLPGSMDEAIAAPGSLEAIAQGCRSVLSMGAAGESAQLKGPVAFAPVVSRPEKIVCVGLNYRTHTQETHETPPPYPLLFGKFPNALAGHGQPVSIPHAASRIDYEAELVLVVGRKACCIAPEEAEDYLFGCTCGNDLSARDAQYRTSQWLIGKSFDGFAPTGPFLAPAGLVDPGLSGHLQQCQWSDPSTGQHLPDDL